ncbi:MAG: cupin domain-containing protein [Bacteroidetes bacterium]|nr:cupin domain-containing protein [Bacteroidota bacterium]MCL5025491.1 cupin domain-containing protein [Chloroflexota bacterium]
MSEKRETQVWYRRSAQAQPVELWPGITRRTLVWGERTMLCEIQLDRGQAVAAHQHPNEQIGYVARGRLRFIVDGQAAILSAGDGYLIASGLMHEVYALEDSVAIDIFSPPRDEYRD